MIRTDEPCKDCLTLAICRNKMWHAIPHHCVKFREEILMITRLELDNSDSVSIRFIPLKKSFTVSKMSDGKTLMIGKKL